MGQLLDERQLNTSPRLSERFTCRKLFRRQTAREMPSRCASLPRTVFGAARPHHPTKRHSRLVGNHDGAIEPRHEIRLTQRGHGVRVVRDAVLVQDIQDALVVIS